MIEIWATLYANSYNFMSECQLLTTKGLLAPPNKETGDGYHLHFCMCFQIDYIPCFAFLVKIKYFYEHYSFFKNICKIVEVNF